MDENKPLKSISSPLAEKLRPKSLDQFIGQEHLLENGAFLKELIESKRPLSILFWGPPGCGKTTLARIYASQINAKFYEFSAVSTSISEIKPLLELSKKNPLFNPYTVLFLDEIHRFNKSQQDLFLPYLEKGSLILIGATTENPSFTLNDALLSRLRVFSFKALSEQDLFQMIENFEVTYKKAPLSQEAKKYLVSLSSGDGRYLINLLENLEFTRIQNSLDLKQLKKILQKRALLFDKKGEGHYNLISALHKSIRGSDPDGALYWLARLLNGGEDPLFIARRLIRASYEDIGTADSGAQTSALNAFKTYQILGTPEGEIALAQATIYLALAPKSNATYTSLKKAQKEAQETSYFPPPTHIINAPNKWMKSQGFGQDYKYDHDCQNNFSGQNYFPEQMGSRSSYYKPKSVGFEREMQKRMDYFNKLRNQIASSNK